MEAITNRLASIFASEPDDAAKVCAFLAVLYITTLVPLLTWAVFKFNGRSRGLVSLPTCCFCALSLVNDDLAGGHYFSCHKPGTSI